VSWPSVRKIRRTVVLAALIGTPAAAQQHDWPVINGGADGSHYSPLKQINRDNVHRLRLLWSFDTRDAFPGSEMECNPIVIDGTLYATTPKLAVIALDAATGRQRWRFDPLGDDRVIGKMRSRGLAYWSDGTDRRIFVAARQYLYALDALTGAPVLGFAQNGRFDLRDGLDRDPPSVSVSLTSPGIVYKDLLIIGSVVPEMLPAAPGDIRALDVRTGKVRWQYHTIPKPGEFGAETWPAEARAVSGGANNWSGMALDEKRGLVFVPTGSAAFDFYGGDRPGDNLFADSLIALDATSGRRVWHFQATHHDLWDRDLPAPPTLATVKRAGRSIDAVVQPTKSGHLFVFNRETGESLFPLETRAVAASEVPGEVASRTQTLPRVPAAFARQSLTPDDVTRRTASARTSVLDRLKGLQSQGQFVPGSFQGTIVLPGLDGGAEWGGAAVDPGSGVLYINANEMAWVLRMVKRAPMDTAISGATVYQSECASCHGADRRGAPPEFPSLLALSDRYSEFEVLSLLYAGGGRMPAFAGIGWERLFAVKNYILYGRDETVATPIGPDAGATAATYTFDGYNKFLDPDGYPALSPPWGTLSAIDLNTGRYLWKQPLGEYPELMVGQAAATGSENYGGPVVTAGGIVFIAATSFDNKFRAFDAATGHLLWQAVLPAAGHATPAVYEIGGREIVVIAAGGGKSGNPSAGVYLAYALPPP